jgi:hypothetical protein
MTKQTILELKGFIPIGIMEWWSNSPGEIEKSFTG